ncbi:MAG TPA: hypothetical protein VFV63_13045 [Ilumatobacteraceae bacterium]|nr:hypothetical protein [Ilumatobacteraceae bacterium]
MSVQAWFAQDEIEIRPGSTTSLSLSVENLGEHTEAYTIIPAGLTAAWTTVTRPNVTLFGGSRDVVEIVIRPPAIHTTTAGPTPAAVRVIPQQQPDEAIVAETLLGVQSFDDRRITMLQPLRRGRRRATFEFMVENHGNNLASCRLHLVDRTERVDGSFDPPAVGVASGSQSLVRLRLKANSGLFRRSERQLDFEIEATEQDHDPAIGHAALIQPPSIPARFAWRVLVAAAVVGAAALAWVNVVRPELRDAAERAVDDRLAEIDTSPSATSPVSDIDVGDSPVETTVPVAPVVEGVPFTTRIVVDVAIGQTGSQSFSVPPDSVFALTDLVVQNPNRDIGTATLLRNSDILYPWNLAQLQSNNEFQPRVTELVFQPGDTIVLQVTCEGAGSTVSTGCSIAVLLSGDMRPTG